MTVEEIFSAIGHRMVKGLMIHDQLSQMFGFLCLPRYEDQQAFRYFDESRAYRRLCSYYTSRYGKLLFPAKIDPPELIPENWFGHVREDVTVDTKRQAVMDIFDTWISWEREVKTFYSGCYWDLLQIGETSAAIYVQDILKDVDQELAEAEKESLLLKATGYDLVHIVELN